MIIAVIIFAIVLLHLVVGLGWVLYKVFNKSNAGDGVVADDSKPEE